MTYKKKQAPADISEEERLLFRQQMMGVRPIQPEKRIDSPRRRPVTRATHHQPATVPETAIALTDPVDLRDINPDEQLNFARSGIQKKVQKRLRRGEYPVEDELDLHGYTVEQARQALLEFIQHCQHRGHRYVRIIHGKGSRSQQQIPVLKAHIACWLPQHPDILAFASCLAKDGGTGAIYAIIKSSP